jgi:hypothetical protein
VTEVDSDYFLTRTCKQWREHPYKPQGGHAAGPFLFHLNSFVIQQPWLIENYIYIGKVHINNLCDENFVETRKEFKLFGGGWG